MPLRPEDLPVDRPEGARAFDFLLGRWRVHNRRLWKPPVGSDDWEEFTASLEVRPILGGLGNVDQYRTVIAGSYFEGITLRLFSLAEATWSIYRADTGAAELLAPVVGTFAGRHGIFFGRSSDEDGEVMVRFRWESVDERNARWDQAYSADGGESWEIDWIMNLERD